MNPRAKVAFVAALLLAASPAVAETVRVSGATQIFAGLFFPYRAEIERLAAVSLELQSNSSAQGIRDLAAGKADIAMISSNPARVAARLNAEHPGTIDASKIVQRDIGQTEISFVVHPSNPVSRLDRDALAGVLAGRIANWAALGGRAAPILLIVEARGGLYADIEQELLKPHGLAWSAGASSMESAVMMTRAVAQSPNAISYMVSSRPVGEVKILDSDFHLTEGLSVVTLGAPSAPVQRVIDAAARMAASGMKPLPAQ